MLSSGKIIGSDDAHDEFLGICKYLRDRVMQYTDDLETSRRVEHGLVPLIAALNALAAVHLASVHLAVKRPQIPYWKETFESWFKRVEKKIPDEFRAELYQNAIAEFDKLIYSSNNWNKK